MAEHGVIYNKRKSTRARIEIKGGLGHSKGKIQQILYLSQLGRFNAVKMH